MAKQDQSRVGTVEDADRYAWERRGTFEVAEGVYRIPLPLPNDGLAAVNVYALLEGDGVALIDAGWALGDSRTHLEEGLAAIDRDLGSIRRVLVTHIHRDHYEQSVVLQREFGTHVALGEGERPSLERIIDQHEGTDDTHPMSRMMRLAGADDLLEELAEGRRRAEAEGRVDHPLVALPDHWLTDDEVIEVGGRRLSVVRTPGHTQGHVVFVDHDNGLLFAGDHILPHITPSIGLEQVPVESPLADYLSSLALVRGMEDLQMLPAHGPVRPTTHDRIDELLVHHEQRLRASAKAVADGHATTYAVARALPWTRRERRFDDLDAFNRMLAVNETAAHLDVLVRQEDLGVVEVDGVRYYAP